METGQKVLIRRSLTRPRLVMGGERNMVALTLALGVYFMIPVKPVWSYLLGLTILVVGLPIIRKMAKTDPLLRQVWSAYVMRPGYLAPTRPVGSKKRRPRTEIIRR